MANHLSLEEMLQRLYEDDKETLRRKQVELDKVYATLPGLLEETAGMMDISAERLARLAKHTTFLHQNVTWYEVVSILHSFHVSQKNLE
jgi:hypothetical protein